MIEKSWSCGRLITVVCHNYVVFGENPKQFLKIDKILIKIQSILILFFHKKDVICGLIYIQKKNTKKVIDLKISHPLLSFDYK